MNNYVYVGIATIFIACFTLFYIFHSIEQLATNCKNNPAFSPTCSKFNGFTTSMLIILLIIGGFVVTITGTAYIMMSSAREA